jgi:multisubunit Na+/H+ antiporter MnhG subunit
MGVAVLAAGLMVLLAALVMDAAGFRRLHAGRRWQGYGVLLAVSGVLVCACAEARDWPVARLRVVHAVMGAGVLAGVALLAVGLVIQFRVRSLSGR